MHRIHVLFLAMTLWVSSVGAPVSGQSAARWIEPEATLRVEPCCENKLNAYPPLKSLAGRSLPHHSFFPPEVKERLQRDAAHRGDLPEGRVLVPAGGTTKALAVTTEFEGLNFLQAGLAFPPDTMVAASPGRVLEATNVALRLTNRGGGNPTRRSLEDFFGLPTGSSFHFDPKIHYDRMTNRFYVMDLNADFDRERSLIYLAVSRLANPRDLDTPDSWCTYAISGRVGRSWADFPGFGMNERWLSISTNNFFFESFEFNSAFVYAIDKQVLAANRNRCPVIDVTRFRAGNDAFARTAFTVTPAQHYSANSLPGTPLFLLSSTLSFDPIRDYTLWRIVERDTGQPGLARDRILGDQSYSFPPMAPQRGGFELDTGDPRVQQAAFRDGVLWAVHSTACDQGPAPAESCVRVLAVEPDADAGRVTFEEIFGGGDGVFLWMPGIAINGRGDLATAFQSSTAATSAGVAFAGKPAGAASFETMTTLIEGSCGLDDFDGVLNRTGDYVGVQTDPADDRSFWIAGEYSGPVGSRACEWRTRVARVAF